MKEMLCKIKLGTFLFLNLDKSFVNKDLPDFDFYLASEKNSLGAVYYEWMEGEELNFKISKVSIKLHENISYLQ